MIESVNLNELAETDFFCGIEPKQIRVLLDCVSARCVQYSKGDFIVEEGEVVNEFGILLSGDARSIRWYSENKPTIINLIKKGSEIGVLIAPSKTKISPVSVQAQNNVSVLLIRYDSLIDFCKGYEWYNRFLLNYINIIANKGIAFYERINSLLKPTIREKVLTYLLRVSNKNNRSKSFVIPLNRNEMAEYLNVERSALSRELSNMKKDNLIDYHKNRFKLLKN